jgi:hypothetical protein
VQPPVEQIVPAAAPIIVASPVPTEIILAIEPTAMIEESAPALPEQTEAVLPQIIIPTAAIEMTATPETVILPEQNEVVAPTVEIIVTDVQPPLEQTAVVDPNILPTADTDNTEVVPPVDAAPLPTATMALTPTIEAPVIVGVTVEPDSALPLEPTLAVTEVVPEPAAEITEEAVIPAMQVAGLVSSAFGQREGIALALTLPDGSQMQTNSDHVGAFLFQQLGPGDYVLEASTPGSLSRRAAFTLADGQGLELPPVILTMGDLNGDNQVDMGDVMLVAANYGNPAAMIGVDINSDGLIDVRDLAIIGAQFGESGPLPWQE